MTTNRYQMAWGLARRAVWTSVVLGGIFLSVGSSFAQNEPVSPAQAREALRQGIDLHKRGEFETADQYFKFARQAQPSLNKAEQDDLATFSNQNANALKTRTDGSAQLKRAAEALQQGKPQDAAVLLKSLDANQYLSSAEQKQVLELNQKVAATASAPASPTDAKSLLSAGRAALQKGDLDLAEAYAAKAQSASSGANWPWSDSPTKLRRDIQTAKAKTPAAPTQAAKAEPEKSSSWLPSLPSLFGKSEKQKEEANEEAASKRRVDELMARRMVYDGFGFLQKGDPESIEKAKFVAMKAKEMNVTWGPNEQTPDQLLHEIQRKIGGPTLPPAAVVDAKPVAAPPIEMPKTSDPRVLLKFGRTLLEQKKFDDADKVCGQVLTMKANWGLWEDTPEKLRRDIQRTKMYTEREDAPKVMAEARKLFAQGNLEEAERKAYKAQQMHGPYGVFDFGDRPSKLIEEIQRAKLAKGKTLPAKTTLPSEGPGANKVEHVGIDFNTNPPTKTGFPTDGVPAGVQSQNKNRAIVMVREARDLERQGKLLEARQKAMEARMLKAPFAPEEDSPDSVLLSLSAQCERQIQAMLAAVAQQVVMPSDPQRFDKAMRQLGDARAMAQTFELDLSRIDQTANYVAQVSSGARPVAPMVNFTASATDIEQPTGDPEKDRLRAIGREKLRDAQTELSHGHYAQARKMAEDIYDAKYGLQTEVRNLLNSITNEEYNQRCLAASRNLLAGVDAYNQRDYRKAQAIFVQVDTLMLPESYQARLRDIMGSREMQPEMLTKVGYQEPIKGSSMKVPEPGYEPKVPSEDLIADQKARDIVVFQQLRLRGLEAQRTAHELMKSKQRDQAMGTLNNYLEQVTEAQLPPDRANSLRRPIEAKIQQYKTFIAQADWEKTEDNLRFPYGHPTEANRIAERKKLQAKTLEMMNESSELYRQHKFKEALEIAKKVREVDPDNVAALAMEKIATTRIRQEEWNAGEHQNEEFNYKILPHTTAPPGIADRDMIFDPKVTTGNKKYDQGILKSSLRDPIERQIDYRLMQPLSLNLQNVPLKDAIRAVALQSGVQVVPDLGPLMAARINLDAPLTVEATGISMKSVLNIMLKPLNLTYIIEDQVLKITTEDRTSGKIVRYVYPVADLVAVPEDHPLPDVFNMQKMIERMLSGGAGMPSFTPPPAYLYNPGSPVSSHSEGLGTASFGTSPGSSGNGNMPPPTLEKKHEMGLVLVDLIKNVIAKDKWSHVGGPGDIHYTPFGMALVVNQVLDVQKDVEELLASLRRLQDLQVSVELRAVLVSESFFERIGVDFNMNIVTPDGPGKAALAAGNTAVASANKTLTGYTQAGTLTPDLNIPILNNTFNFTQPQFGGYQPGAGLSLGLAFLSDIQVFMFLEAVSGDQRAHVMQAPKLTVYNGQTAFITANVARPFMSGVTPILAPNGLPVMIPQMTVYPLGLGMQVQPVVSPDRRFVRLNISPQLTSGFIDPAGQIIIPVPAFPANGLPPLFNTGNIQPPLPTVPLQVTNGLQFNPLVANVNVLQTTVNVPDGGTVLMGGFKFLAEQRSEYGPPVLSNIPYLSRLFRNVGWSRDSATLLYLVTARIIMVEEEEQIFLGNLRPIPRDQ